MEVLHGEELRVLRADPAEQVSSPAARPDARLGRALWLGRVSHDRGLAVQRALHADVASGRAPDTLLLQEHDSTYTVGRAAREHVAAHFLAAPEDLVLAGHAVRETDRGGDVTWHGPGQLVAYPILNLSDGRRDIHRYLRLLEDMLISTCAEFSVAAWREPGRTGAWTRGGKIASIGIRVARWVTQHGTALNVSPDLAHFDAIVACGIHGARATSLERELGAGAPALHDVARAQARAFSRAFETELPQGVEMCP